MSGFELDAEERSLFLDLHDYTVNTALVVFETKLQEAWRAGLKCLQVVHGAPYAVTQEDSIALGRGSIKWAVMNLLDLEDWAQYVERVEPEDGSTLIYLKPNPSPEEVGAPSGTRVRRAATLGEHRATASGLHFPTGYQRRRGDRCGHCEGRGAPSGSENGQ